VTFPDLICPVCKYVHPVRVINGEPCIERADGENALDYQTFVLPKWTSLSRWVGMKCQGSDHLKGEAPTLIVLPEYFPGFVQTMHDRQIAKMSFGDMERTKTALRFLLSVIQAPYMGSRLIIKPWEVKIFDDMSHMNYDVLAWRHMGKLDLEARPDGLSEIVDRWHEAMLLCVPYEQFDEVFEPMGAAIRERLDAAHKIVGEALRALLLTINSTVPK
jgi:hypothetical protein